MFSSTPSRSYVWLGVAMLLFLVAVGKWTIPVATWLVPIFLLRFVRQQPAWRGYLFGALGITLAGFVSWQGHIPFSGVAFYGFVTVASFIGVLPYLVDRLLTPRLSGLAATLVFPTAVTTLEYLLSFGDYGTWGAVAYTQQHLPLLQVVAVTGIWGIAFLIHWTASVVATAWASGVEGPRIRRPAIACATVLVAVVLAGSLRLTFTAPSNTIPVATITGSHTVGTFLSSVNLDDPSALRDSARIVQDDYLDRARRAAEAGARLVAWPEAAVPVVAAEEDAFVERGQGLAREEDVYLAMALAALPSDLSATPLDNKVVWIGPDGTVLDEYLKARPVPGEPSRAGDGHLPLLETPHGTWTSVICFDMDFPDLLRQAGQRGADVIVAPSNDWQAIESIHAHMARFRAIENGTALVRPTSNGRTLVTDPLGRTIGQMSHFTTDTHLLTAQVPTRGVPTLYPLIGDAFAWLCGLGFLALVGTILLRSRGSSRTEPTPETARR